MTYDHINPLHYKGDRSYEPIDVIEDWGLNYHLANALKYISRNGRKPGEDPRQGISKAIWYLERYKQKLDEQHAQGISADEQEEQEFRAMGEIPSSVLPGPDDSFYPFEDCLDEEDPWDPDLDPYEPVDRNGNPVNLPGKDLSKFEDHEIVTTHHINGSILGTQKNGDVVVLGSTGLYDEILDADPLDLAPSEYEFDR